MKTQMPTEKTVNQGTSNEGVLIEHPAFALVMVSRNQIHGKTRLYGSDLNHGHTITLMVREASSHRMLNQEWNQAGKLVCEIEMSQAQFTRMAASGGAGEGVPCTMRQQQVGPVQQVPQIDKPSQSRSALHMEEMEQSMRAALEGFQSVLLRMEGLANAGGTIPKKDFKELVAEALRLGEQLPGNLSFAQKQFRKAMETTVEDSKTEIEIFLASVARQGGAGQIDHRLAVPGLESPGDDATPV